MNEVLNPIDASRQPVVFARDGEVFASSRDVAAYFGKEHRNVLRDIDALIKTEPDLARRQFDAEGGMLSFEQAQYVDPQNGQTYRHYVMTRDGFTLLAMGFTGATALKFKIAYIAQFNAMEAELRARPIDPMKALADPIALRGLLLTYSEKVLALEEKTKEMAGDVAALDRIAKSDGSLCVTDAAKTLQVAPKALFKFLRAHGWIYSRPGSGADIAYQSKLSTGLLEHKTTTVERSDGTEKTVTQVRVTPKGLARLAKEFPPIFTEVVPSGH